MFSNHQQIYVNTTMLFESAPTSLWINLDYWQVWCHAFHLQEAYSDILLRYTGALYTHYKREQKSCEEVFFFFFFCSRTHNAHFMFKASISPFYKMQIPFCRFTIFRVLPLISFKNSTNRPKFTVFFEKKFEIGKSRNFCHVLETLRQL